MSTTQLAIGALCCLLACGLMSCTNGYSDRRDDGAREAGREAYRASKGIKRGAKQAHDLRTAGKEFRQGWDAEKHEQPPEHHQ